MDSGLTVSVIIPTYNRKSWLRETLKSLCGQTWPASHLEVIVVDDGSEDGTEAIASEAFPFTLRYIQQSNQGDAAARNTGARQSQSDVIVFLDDDVLVGPEYLACLVQEHESFHNRIVVGTEYLWLKESNPLSHDSAIPAVLDKQQTIEIPFANVCSNNMSLRREAYFSIGLMQGLDFPGSSIWCDVDFNYRAYRQGYAFYRSPGAICWHRDYVARSLDNQKRRMREVAYRAVVLFQRHPDLLPHLPMFEDKTPIAWGQDPIRLVARKVARTIISSRPALWIMERLAGILEERRLPPRTLRPFHRWIVGGYISQGYREGLREFRPVRE